MTTNPIFCQTIIIIINTILWYRFCCNRLVSACHEADPGLPDCGIGIKGWFRVTACWVFGSVRSKQTLL